MPDEQITAPAAAETTPIPVETATSDVAEATPASADTGPRDTSSVARETLAALEKAEQSDGGDEDRQAAASGTDDAATASPETPPESAEEVTEADKLLKEAGYEAKVGNRDNRIPYNRVKTIITNQLAKERQTFETERNEAQTKIADYEKTLEEVSQVESLMLSSDPQGVKAFLDGLAEVNPVLKTVLTQMAAPAASATSETPVSSEMPKPNAKLPDGTMTYDLDGIRALLNWNTAQVEQRLAPKFKTIEDLETARRKELEAVETTRRQQALTAQHEQAVETQLQEAQKWPGFADHHDAILEVLKADSAEARRTKTKPKHTLESAYRQVVVPKLLTNRDTLRAEILKEINQQPRSTSVVKTSSVTAPVKPGLRTTEDIARETIRRLETGA